ncbi:precorrin-6Y C5,15-methyltransferase (decarboxylating) [Dulcicalothrix desertica PCC 7102]|uniref:Precorrin-6Y C5,15-methyltransferase (Decarboxylating) n=2 Tax=Dulcicalothrix desertica TaxID=32056 RepID=A0A3S1D7A2_9CYAN|nr:precorrin-6Y C5,15-methyltransferase (decarboxylating) [Dulcicalothrix desertica PCC 7102]
MYEMKWLSVVGIGEDGLSGLGNIARSLVDQASILVGGRRHLAMLSNNDGREKVVWSSPIQQTVEEIIRRRPKSVCVLASGDPMCFGIGVTLTRFIDISEMTIIPAPSAFSLACARLGWSLTDVETFSLCGRPVELANSYFYLGAKLLILSADKHTPGIIADNLTKSGFCESKITILERMGSVDERIVTGIASQNGANFRDLADLNTIAVECIADVGVTGLSRLAGLPDNAYHHDGQLTKREVRAVTLAALAPKPGELLWDVGAGCGSISIEWMRSHSSCRAIAIEQSTSRLKYISDNAASLGTPYIDIIQGKAPNALQNLSTPNVIFIGGGVTSEGVLETCWQALPKNGRLVANVVTIEGEQKLFEWYQKVGGELSRIAIQRAEPIGKFMGWKAMAPVTQWSVIKS